MPAWKEMSLTTRILLAMSAGIIFGSLLNVLMTQLAVSKPFIETWLTDGLFQIVGQLFIRALQMIVVPLVFVSLAMGVTKLGDAVSLGRIGIKTISLYLFTTALAITLALLMATLIGPGEGGIAGLASTATYETGASLELGNAFISMMPDNIIKAMSQGDMIPIIVFAILFGIGIMISGEQGRHVYNFFNDLDSVILKIVFIILKFAPYGVFCLVADTFATVGIDAILDLGEYFVVVLLTLVLHAVVSYSLLLKLVGRLNPWVFFKKMRTAMTFAFSTSSSNATLPVTFDTVENRLGAKNSIASFTIPLGATINMDGTAIMQGVATVFIANAYNIDLSLSQYLLVILTATLASIGTAGIPSVGLVMLTLVFKQIGLPVEAIAMLWGIDRLLDMTRTAVNITGDAAVTCLVAQSEKALDLQTFEDPHAGSIKPGTSRLRADSNDVQSDNS